MNGVCQLRYLVRAEADDGLLYGEDGWGIVRVSLG